MKEGGRGEGVRGRGRGRSDRVKKTEEGNG
jgi:hypothetical protein